MERNCDTGRNRCSLTFGECRQAAAKRELPRGENIMPFNTNKNGMVGSVTTASDCCRLPTIASHLASLLDSLFFFIKSSSLRGRRLVRINLHQSPVTATAAYRQGTDKQLSCAKPGHLEESSDGTKYNYDAMTNQSAKKGRTERARERESITRFPHSVTTRKEPISSGNYPK